jgi:hypothetical protein
MIAAPPRVTSRFWRCRRQPQPTVPRIMKPTIDATTLCVYSIITFVSNGGTTFPWHRGQSGHAVPESVERTVPPRTMSPQTAIAVTTARTR